MKNVISTLLFPIVIALQFVELNAMEGVGESSGYCRQRPGLRRRTAHQFDVVHHPQSKLLLQAEQAPIEPGQQTREPLGKLDPVEYMSHKVQLRLVDGQVTEVIYPGNQIPKNAEFFKEHDCLVRLALIKKHVMVIYLTKDETLLGARPPNPSVKFMEPNFTKWYLAYEGHIFTITVAQTAFNRLLPYISDIVAVQLKNGNYQRPFDTVEPMQFAGIRFLIHRRILDQKEITGVTRPSG